MKARHILTLAAGIMMSTAAFAQDNVALPFIRIDRNPATAAMGGAGSASTSSIAWSSFRNSAVIPFSEEKADVAFSFQNWAPSGAKSSNMNLGFGYKISEKFGFSVGGAYQSGAEYQVTDESGNMKDPFKPSDLLVNAGLGMKFTDALGAGVNVRYASEKVADDDSYSSICADAFLFYRIKQLNITAGISSIGSSVKDAAGNSYSIPASATVGLDYVQPFADVHDIELALDADYFLSGSFTAALGAQYSFKDMVSVRAGYHIGASDAVLPSFATLGAGFKFKGVRLDLTWLGANEIIGNSLTIGLRYSF